MGPAEWAVYQPAIQGMRDAGIPFLLGGAFGLAAYTGRWRNTKDLDFFVRPRDRERAVDRLTELGFTDYYPRLAYDRGWIYRAIRSEVIVDVIWATPNRRTEVDEDWFKHARQIVLRQEPVDVLPAEELAWIKLYVLQRDRCDWPDVINLLYATSASLDWGRLVDRLGDDLPLLQGLLSVFAWLCPDRLDGVPARLRKRLGIKTPLAADPNGLQRRINLIDTRPWFAALQPCDKPMQL
jgi:hypothetical protein